MSLGIILLFSVVRTEFSAEAARKTHFSWPSPSPHFLRYYLCCVYQAGLELTNICLSSPLLSAGINSMYHRSWLFNF